MKVNVNNILNLDYFLTQLNPHNAPSFNELIIDALAREFIQYQGCIEASYQRTAFNEKVVDILTNTSPRLLPAASPRTLWGR